MLVAGLMSGTSADGIDVAVAEITGQGWYTRVRLRAFQSVAYPASLRRRVLEIAGGRSATVSEISQMNFMLGELFARACRKVCQQSGIALKRLELIGSHGQTIYHQNHASALCGVPVRSTLQIGEPAVIAERTGVTTVADFRPSDIAAGGHGAPLVPFFDYLLYRHPRHGRIVLNLGGIANLTAIPAAGAPEQVIAFDTGPGNMLLDALAARATAGRWRYDRQGQLASRGTVHEPLLRRLLRQAYFRRPPPKSAGREQFGDGYLKQYFQTQFGSSRQALCDALATAAALTAESVTRAIGDFVLRNFCVEECVVSGGGIHNRFLMRQLEQRLAVLAKPREPRKSSRPRELKQGIRLLTSDSTGIPADAKEAIAFAVLAYQTIHRQPSNLCAATGARHAAILGKVVYAKQ
ncbi:MAG: anhydro-N-acetylmuramic acid kinase [Acidobacteria bacterium]|nr:anhydro-N-acetylmuramic acid kinase [Acidobacteriota bacterium]